MNRVSRRRLAHGGLSLLRLAEGGKIRQYGIPDPQSQKIPNAVANDSRGTPMSKEWFENYGSGPEHLFLGDRRLPTVGPFARESLPPPPKNQGGGSGSSIVPLLGMGAVVGKDLYDWYQNRPGKTPKDLRSIDQGAADVSGTRSWIDQQLGSMPMPSADFDTDYPEWMREVDRGAADTSDTNAWIDKELGNMQMPEVDPSLWDRTKTAGGGLLGMAVGSQQGGLEGYSNMLTGAGKLGEAGFGKNPITGGLGQAGSALGGASDIYSGIQSGGVAGYGQALTGAADLANTLGYGSRLTQGISGAGKLASGQYLSGAKDLAGAAGQSGANSALSAVGKAVPIAAAAFSAYNAYEAAAQGDKKGAIMNGAAAGASIGSVIPVVGTAVGAVVGAVVGLIGASLGNKEKASEVAYKSHKKLKQEEVIRGWSEDQANGALFESIKSHTKSGNVKRFEDVGDMFAAFGITKDAHKNYRKAQNEMSGFITGVVQTAIQSGQIDPSQIKNMDGQEFFYKVVTPAMAAKVAETTGKAKNGWSQDRSKNPGAFHGMLADYTDYIMSHWGEKPYWGGAPEPARTPTKASGFASGMQRRVQMKAHGGLTVANNLNESKNSMMPRRGGGLSMAMAPKTSFLDNPSSYYRYGQQAPSQGVAQPMPSAMPPQRSGMRPGGAIMRAMGGGLNLGYGQGGGERAHRLVRGPGTGRSDDIPAKLSDGEYVFDAETVALLGDGSTDEGARQLDRLREKLRQHKGKKLAKGKFSLKAKRPEQYLE